MSTSRKMCPILTAAHMVRHSEEILDIGVFNGISCVREQCEWYGNGCPAYPSQLEIDMYAENKKFFEELNK